MDTVEQTKKARDEIQALIDGSSSKLSADVIRWILTDMRQSSEYSTPMQLAARDYPDLQNALRDAQAAFNNFGLLPDVKTIGGRLFVEKILSVSLGRLNGMLYTLGVEDEGALYGYAENLSKMSKQLAALRVKRKIVSPLSPLALSIGKSLASVWAKGALKASFEADVRAYDVRTDDGYYFARSAFFELIDAGAIEAAHKGGSRVSVTLLPQLKAL